MAFHIPIFILAVVGALFCITNDQPVFFGAWIIVCAYVAINMNELRLRGSKYDY